MLTVPFPPISSAPQPCPNPPSVGPPALLVALPQPAKPNTFLLEYPWTAYCDITGLGPMTPDKCGRCLKVTNPATGQSVRTIVVDECGQGGVDMDPLGFDAIDGNGAGYRDGHMYVDLEWC